MSFSTLFAGNRTAYFDSFTTTCVRRPVTEQLYLDHLSGEANIGIYPVLPNATVHWGCFDIDFDSIAMARKVSKVAEDFGLLLWMERSKSKGFHLWCFVDDAVPPTVMRWCLQYIDRMAKSEIPEINPKGDSGLVNCVRLPYSPTADPGRMVCIVPETEEEIPVELFVEVAMAHRNESSLVRSIAGKHEARETIRVKRQVQQAARQRRSRTPSTRSNQLAARIFRGEERIRVGQRDECFFVLAQYLTRGLGLSAGEAETEIRRIHGSQCDDPSSFSVEDAVRKVARR